jgi:putative membrane protein
MTGFFFLPVWGFAGPVFWVVVIGMVVLATRSSRDAGGSAVRLLEERYARGEITREEFLERREVLDRA